VEGADVSDELDHPDGRPAGDVYDWYRRGVDLLDAGDAAAAVQLLAHVHDAEPGSVSVREALARAQFDARMYDDSERTFRSIVAASPDDDYAHFGLGLSLQRLGRFHEAAQHLAAAATMRPEREPYAAALREVRATLRARRDA
jgi:Flp pilus assembly protein TadD